MSESIPHSNMLLLYLPEPVSRVTCRYQRHVPRRFLGTEHSETVILQQEADDSALSLNGSSPAQTLVVDSVTTVEACTIKGL